MAEFRVLYTHQKSKKRKVWQDGTLGFTENGRKGTLCDDSGNRLDAVYVRPETVAVGDELESDRHLITIEEETKSWQPQSTSKPSPPADAVAAPVVPHHSTGGSVSERRVTPGKQSAHRTKLGKRKHLGAQTRDVVGFHINELRRRDVLELEASTSSGVCRSEVPSQLMPTPEVTPSHSQDIGMENYPRRRNVTQLSRCGHACGTMGSHSELGDQHQQGKSLEIGHHTQMKMESYGLSQPKRSDTPFSTMNTLGLRSASANSFTGQTRRSPGQILGLLRSKAVHPLPPPSQRVSTPATESHGNIGVVTSELLPPPYITTPTSFSESEFSHHLPSSGSCEVTAVASHTAPPLTRSLPDVSVASTSVSSLKAQRELSGGLLTSVELDSEASPIKQNAQSCSSRTLKSLTSQPEADQSDSFPLSTSQLDFSISEAAAPSTHTTVTLRPLVSLPEDFDLQTSQSDFGFVGDQNVCAAPTESDQLECCVETVPFQQSPKEILVSDSLSEGSIWSETDQSPGGMASNQTKFRDDFEDVIDLTESQSSSVIDHSQPNQSECNWDLEYNQLEITQLHSPVQPANQSGHSASHTNQFPATQSVSAKRKIGPRVLRKSKQGFNCPYTQWGPQLKQLETEKLPNPTVNPKPKASISAPHKGKFRAPLLRGEPAPGVLEVVSDFGGPLRFPSQHEVTSLPSPLRHTLIPTTFSSAHQYRQVLSVAIREHLNIVLFKLANRYHQALTRVKVQGSQMSESGSQKGVPSCKHGPAELHCVKKSGPNKGRLFYVCSASGSDKCKFFKWADEVSRTSSGGQSGGCQEKVQLSTPQEFDVYLRGHQINMYSNCQIVRKCLEYDSHRKFKKGSRWQREDQPASKKHLFISLPRREVSSQYAKDDLWVISRDLSFVPEGTFLAKSMFYGPTSSNLLEISPISGYSPSNWPSSALANCIHAGSASSELCWLDNLEEHVRPPSLHILPALLTRSPGAGSEGNTVAQRGFIPPTASCHSNAMVTNDWSNVMALADDMIGQYHLNADQSEALKQCARMFKPESSPTRITLIHGVFGAGKSYLLTVIILFMVKLFRLQGPWRNSSRTPQKVLISSTTNVAVDRILIGLLDHGFEEFVRVGSVKKIAKPVLPYSIHSSGTESQELKELQDMLKGDISASEKVYVRKSIERHKLGVNKKRLSQVHVVGVTCAACVFPLMADLQFPVLLLDECSQMTEPASLLPMARFGCEKCVLVGDPKQLAPPIQGSDPAHQSGLEQTLFERLADMGYEPVVLRTQYRCHPTLSAISNSLFYQSQLVDGVSCDERQPLLPNLPTLCFLNVSNGREESASDGSYYNTEESKVVIELLENLLDADIPPASIGVITLYKAQMRHIRSGICSSRSSGDLKSIQISTVDAFQGGEREVIILSSVRTQHVGFIDSDRRTNVALTRAKRHLLILGNQRMLYTNEVWGHVIRHCESTPGGIQQARQFLQQIRKESQKSTH